MLFAYSSSCWLRSSWSILAASTTVLVACGGGGGDPRKAEALALGGAEDQAVAGQLAAADSQGQAVAFSLVNLPTKGVISLDVKTGYFNYTPAPDMNGRDSFSFVATSSAGVRSLPTSIVVDIAPVNDAPVVASLPNVANSPDVLETRIKLVATDADGDALQISVRSANSQVAGARIDSASGEIVLSPLDYGQSTIEVNVSDGHYSVRRSFNYTVSEVTRRQALSAKESSTEAVVIENRSNRLIRFVLEHNGNPVFKNVEHVVQHVKALPDEIVAEGFERKLWRYLRDATRHYYPPMPLQFKQAPWATLNSLGFGFCGDLSTTYASIARAAGYEARVWSLGGHVVPEIRVGGQWQLYDPDLGVYYRRRDGAVASVNELAADPSLVRHPISPVVAEFSGRAYSAEAERIYGSLEDNLVADATLMPTDDDFEGSFEMPPDAKLVYPGRWTAPPVSYVALGENILFEKDLPNWRALALSYDGAASFDAPFHRQARMTLPDGWVGELRLPLWLYDVQGTGQVRIDGVDYTVGSAKLIERLRYRQSARSITVLSGYGLALVMQINFVRFAMKSTNVVRLTGRDVGATRVSTQEIGLNGAGDVWTWPDRRPLQGP